MQRSHSLQERIEVFNSISKAHLDNGLERFRLEKLIPGDTHAVQVLRPPQSAASGLPAATGYLRYVVHNQLAEVVREILPDFENVVCEVSTITEEADNRTIHFLTK
ncbi:hypothetical protein LguiA_028842 [Lonicera macranthoides]